MNGFLKVLLIILVIILCLLLFLSFKLKTEFIYRNKKAEFSVKYFFIKIPISLKVKEKEKTQQKDLKKKNRSNAKDENFFESVSNLLTALSSAGRIVKTALSLHKAEIVLKAKICSDDAAKTAIEVGKTSAFVHSALGVLANFVRIKKRDISLCPDYEGKESDYDLYVCFYSRPINLLFNINKFLGDLSALADALPNKK